MSFQSDDHYASGNHTYWHAIYTMPRSEKKVYERLQQKGINPYLPLMPSFRTWSDRKKKIFAPLIPGFVFIKAEEAHLFKPYEIDSALGFIRYLGQVAKIRDFEIDNLRILLKEPGYIQVIENIDLSGGDDIIVTRGPFVGLYGKCIRVQGKYKVVVSIDALGSAVEVTVPMSFLEVTSLKVA